MQEDRIELFEWHGIDIANLTAVPSLARDITDELKIWQNDLLVRIKGSEKRRFNFRSDTTEIITLVKRIIVGGDSTKSDLARIADRLVEKERIVQDKMKQIATLQKGSLIQILISNCSTKTYLIAKVEHEAIIDETDHQKHIGLPYDKHIYKTCLITFDEDNEVLEVIVSDNNRKKISDYWQFDFLELKELSSDEHNTRKSFNFMDQLISRRLKSKHPSDYIQIRNNLVGYFRTSTTFSFADMVETVVGSYEPDDVGFDVGLFKAELQAVPAKLKQDSATRFDESFNIIKTEITARFKKTIDLSDKITLKLKEDIENLRDVIVAVEDKGKKYIRIESEMGYKFFKKALDESN